MFGLGLVWIARLKELCCAEHLSIYVHVGDRSASLGRHVGDHVSDRYRSRFYCEAVFQGGDGRCLSVANNVGIVSLLAVNSANNGRYASHETSTSN